MTRLRALVVSAALAALLTCVLGPFSAYASPIGSCTVHTGTIVAVDFGHWDGPVVRGCDTGSPSDGASLLGDAGFTTTNVQGEAFLCRIGNRAFDSGKQYPTGVPCTRTPPATGYWSYWTAAAGQNRWTYSKLGAYEQRVSPGEVELWTFGTTSTPTIAPNSLRQSTPTPRHTTPAPHQTQTQPSRHRARSSSAAHAPANRSSNPVQARRTSPAADVPAQTGHQPSTAPARSSSGLTASSSSDAASRSSASGASGSSVAGGSAPSEQIVDAQPAGRSSTSASSAVPLIVGIAIVAVLAAGGGFTVWRRRGGTD